MIRLRDIAIDCVMAGVALLIIFVWSQVSRGDELKPVPDTISTPSRIILPTIGEPEPIPEPQPQPEPQPNPEPKELQATIAIGELYLIEFPDEPWRVFDSRKGVVSIVHKTGGREFYSRFADSKTDRLQPEWRTVEAPSVCVVSGVVPGQIELICVPPGVGEEQRIILTVTGANPPPGPTPGPVLTDVLATCHKADRVSQIEILRALAAKNLSRDAAGLTAAKEFVNAERIRRRTEDWIPYTDAVAESIFDGTVGKLADTLEGNP